MDITPAANCQSFWNKKRECCLLGHAKLLHVGGLFLCHLEDGSCLWGWGQLSPTLAWPSGMWGCGTTHQRLCSATLLPISPISSPFMRKAGKSSKGFSYLEVLEKLVLDFKMRLKTNLFILLQNFSASAERELHPSTFIANYSTADLDQELLNCHRGLAWRCSATCFLHLYFTTWSQSAFSLDGIAFSPFLGLF